MVDKVLINNMEKYELSFLEFLIELRAINYLKSNNALNDEICKCVKKKIKEDLHNCVITTIPLDLNIRKG